MGFKGEKGLFGFYGKKGSMDYKIEYLFWIFSVMKIENLNFSFSLLL